MPAFNDDANDDDIADVFVEEAEEVLESIDRHFAVWKNRPTDQAALAEIRRAFHTLKGSGRMVKALDLGELAWKVENMLNRAMDGTIAVSEPMVAVVGATRGVVPRMLEAFKQQRKPDNEPEIDSIMAQADALAAGKPAPAAPARAAAPVPAAPAPTAAGDDIPIKLSELYRRLERHSQRADEALHRSEIALQQVRRLASQIQAMQGEAQDRPSRAELNPLVERINALTKEVLELRSGTKKAQTEAAPVPNPRELQQLIDQRVRERLAAAERMKPETDRQLDQIRQSADSARNLAIGALVLALALAGGAVALLTLAPGLLP